MFGWFSCKNCMNWKSQFTQIYMDKSLKIHYLCKFSCFHAFIISPMPTNQKLKSPSGVICHTLKNTTSWCPERAERPLHPAKSTFWTQMQVWFRYVQMIFLYNCLVFRFQRLIFRDFLLSKSETAFLRAPRTAVIPSRRFGHLVALIFFKWQQNICWGTYLIVIKFILKGVFFIQIYL